MKDKLLAFWRHSLTQKIWRSVVTTALGYALVGLLAAQGWLDFIINSKGINGISLDTVAIFGFFVTVAAACFRAAIGEIVLAIATRKDKPSDQ